MALNKQNTAKNETISLYRNEALDIGFYDYFKNAKDNKISQILNSKERNVKFETITYRQLNSWDKEGLLTTGREGREWRRFSIMDAIWVKLLNELRSFGLSWEQLKNTKQSLEFGSAKCKVPMPLLEFYIAFAIGSKMPVLLLVFKDGVAVPANFSQYKIANEYLGIENHLQINLNEILQNFFPNVDLKPAYKTELPVSVDEMELLAFMRVKQFEKIEVFYKNGKMDLIEGLERVNNQKRITEILREQQYCDINLIQHDGKTVSVTRKIKKKIKK